MPACAFLARTRRTPSAEFGSGDLISWLSLSVFSCHIAFPVLIIDVITMCYMCVDTAADLEAVKYYWVWLRYSVVLVM